MQTFMSNDSGMESTAQRAKALGNSKFTDDMQPTETDRHSMAGETREERQRRGHVMYTPEPHIPPGGGPGSRTKEGHMLKNQGYYSSRPKTNLWDIPTHAGTNTWKEWHGPRLRSDAEMMERMDRFEEEEDRWQAKRTFVNTSRVQTLDRFYNRKLHQSNLANARSWAPHHVTRREVHGIHENFMGDLDSRPQKELKKVLTDSVLKRDRDAMRMIAKRIQKEETWKQVWKQMEQERRADIRADLQQRQAHNDWLMQMSGQPMRPSSQLERPNNASQRSIELAQPRPAALPKDVTQQVDFAGLFHVDNEHAFEVLFPGTGHELSVEFRKRTSETCEAGWPPPPDPETPRMGEGSHSREKAMRKECELSKEAIPTSTHRLERVATRVNDDLFKKHAKAQFLPTHAPPPPNQSQTLLNEEWSPHAILKDPDRVTGSFARTQHTKHPHSPKSKAMGDLPPAIRSYVYPVMAPSSPSSPSNARRMDFGSTGPGSPSSSCQGLTRTNTAPAVFSAQGPPSAGRAAKRAARQATRDVCGAIEEFEARNSSVTLANDFFR